MAEWIKRKYSVECSNCKKPYWIKTSYCPYCLSPMVRVSSKKAKR